MTKNNTISTWIATGGIIALLFILFGIAINPNFAINEDLGRHIKLGEIIWQTQSVPTTNLFTYTNPDFPFLNHHWLAEVFFYSLNQYAGLEIISLIKITVIVIAVLLVFSLANNIAGFLPALFSATILAPIMMTRANERPEIFGFLFFALLLLILYGKEKPSKKYLTMIPFILLIWINAHLSFIYGVFLFSIFLLKNIWLFSKKLIQKDDIIFYFSIFITSVLALFVNPNGIRAMLYPFGIFQNYGYMIIENQDVFFLLTRIGNKLIPYFLIVAPIIIIAIIYAIFLNTKNKKNYHFPLTTHYKLQTTNYTSPTTHYSLVFIALIFAILSFLALRNFPFFVLSAIPAFAIALKIISEKYLKKWRKYIPTAVLSLIVVNLVFAIFLYRQPMFNFGIAENYKNGVDFFLTNNLPGNIFNNFDIGGYLDYRLYPQYKTFVDNRPEAFPQDFFEKYRQIQTDPKIRRAEFQKYNINSIIFSINDITPWAQEFLKQIVQDPEWQTIYLDNAMIILIKKKTLAI